ncbi:hypothetical protein AM1_A0292 (plasmid) [Acaryochloris marina MBIC11017]|uniref:Uncharacterized protein n=1 Tax=Acaryochloris marina (strain MBIC 11017) TaxID=329726 RepID=A8ZKU2_ACAM1|nr:hypothetical protein AM1_A0292 [Acaryochloris marina MBIC11017]
MKLSAAPQHQPLVGLLGLGVFLFAIALSHQLKLDLFSLNLNFTPKRISLHNLM